MRASVLVAIGNVVFKLAGLIQAMVMGRVLSKETYDIVYGFAFENCIFTIFLVGEELIGPALMPIFMQELNSEGGERSAWSFAGAVLWIQGAILLAVMGLLMLFPGVFVQLFTRWSYEETPRIFMQAVASVRSLAPVLLGLSLASATYVILNAYKRFFLAAFANAVWKLTVAILLIGGALLVPGKASFFLTAGLLAGSLLKFGTHLAALRDKAKYIRVAPNFRHPALGTFLRLMLPLVVGVLFAKWRDIFNNVHVLSGISETGLIQANSMGRKLSGAISMLLPYTISVAIFPFLCEMVDRRAQKELGELLTRSGRMLVSVLLPLAALLAVSAVPLTGLLYGGGRFDQQAINWTSISMIGYTFALPAMALEMLLMQAFFANRRTISVTVCGIAFSGFSVLVSYWTVVTLEWRGALALAGIAGGLSLSRWMKTITLVALLRRNAPVFPPLATLWFFLRSGLVAVLCAVAGWGAMAAVKGLLADGRLSWIVQLAAAGIAVMPAFVAGCALLRVNEPREMLLWLLARLGRRQVTSQGTSA